MRFAPFFADRDCPEKTDVFLGSLKSIPDEIRKSFLGLRSPDHPSYSSFKCFQDTGILVSSTLIEISEFNYACDNHT